MFGLNNATEQEQQSYTPLPQWTWFRMKAEFQAPNAGFGEVAETRGGPEWGQYLVTVPENTRDGVTYPETTKLKLKLTITGSTDGKFVKSVQFQDLVISGGRPPKAKDDGSFFPSDAENGQSNLWDLLCVANGVSQKSPEGLALKKQFSVGVIHEKEFALQTGKTYVKQNGDSVTPMASRFVASIDNKVFQQAMSWGKATTGFGGVSQSPVQQQTNVAPPSGTVGGWG